MSSLSAVTAPSREKRQVALASLIAALFLMAVKLMVGFATGSLGVLSEAAHSALDLLAVAITYISIRTADAPADEIHPFGHGKVENLAAFIQIGLLFMTTGWIVIEAFNRLFLREVHVQPSAAAFAVLITAIVIDTIRARALSRAAGKYQSQALEVNALHFSTDAYGTGVVLLGLALLYAAQHGFPDWLRHADAIAGLVVAGLTLYVGLRLGRASIYVLLDAAPAGVPQRISSAVAEAPGVLRLNRTRVRQSGPKLFVDLRITLNSNIPFEHATSVVDAVKAKIRQLYPTADIVVDAVPGTPPPGDLLEKIRSIAHQLNFQVHDVVAFTTGGHLRVELDLEVDEALPLRVAHDQATQLEAALRAALPGVEDINVHIEPRAREVTTATKAIRAQAPIERKLLEIVRGSPGVVDCHALEAHRMNNDLAVTVHCTVKPGLSVTQVHALTEELELRLREAFPQITRVNIHPEPQLGSEQTVVE